MRISLIHALRHSMTPIDEAFQRLWPSVELRHLLDDSLSVDLARAGGLTEVMTDRFLHLTRYAVDTGSAAVLFTCSAFGPSIDACAAAFPDFPILKPNEAMIAEAAALRARVGLLATFAPTLLTMPAEFPPEVELRSRFVAGALEALDRGDGARHDCLAIEAAKELDDCPVIALAQFSLARAAREMAARLHKPVLTTPDCAVQNIKRLLS
jgi:hypothetical protein